MMYHRQINQSRIINLTPLILIYYRTVCIESVDKSGGIKVTFKNSTEDDLRILKWYTPLEGMMTPFLTVTDETGEELEYAGLMAKRVSNPTHENFEVIPSGKSVTSDIINLDDTYDLEEGIKYTIKYTGSIEYIAGSIELTEEILEDLNEQEMTEAGKGIIIEIKHKKRQYCTIHYQSKFVGGTEEQYSCTQRLLKELKDPNRGYPKVIEAVHPNDPLYQKWFGEYNEKRAEKVRKVYQKCRGGLEEDNEIRYVFNIKNTGKLESVYGYYESSQNEMGFTERYNNILERAADDSKLQVLVHELSHAHGNTIDIKKEGRGVKNCLQMAKDRPDAAVKNADSYGYFYCDVAVLEGRIPIKKQ